MPHGFVDEVGSWEHELLYVCSRAAADSTVCFSPPLSPPASGSSCVLSQHVWIWPQLETQLPWHSAWRQFPCFLAKLCVSILLAWAIAPSSEIHSLHDMNMLWAAAGAEVRAGVDPRPPAE
jgi:hypothetical protein